MRDVPDEQPVQAQGEEHLRVQQSHLLRQLSDSHVLRQVEVGEVRELLQAAGNGGEEVAGQVEEGEVGEEGFDINGGKCC